MKKTYLYPEKKIPGCADTTEKCIAEKKVVIFHCLLFVYKLQI